MKLENQVFGRILQDDVRSICPGGNRDLTIYNDRKINFFLQIKAFYWDCSVKNPTGENKRLIYFR